MRELSVSLGQYMPKHLVTNVGIVIEIGIIPQT